MIRIAMVGGGPKCLFALLELNDVLSDNEGQTVQVDVYDPYPPGAGRVWNTTQPKELRLNVNSRIIDASSSLCEKTFDQYRQPHASDKIQDVFAPRAEVGAYLSEQFELLTKHGELSVSHRPLVVQRVQRQGEQWAVSTTSGAELYDEVVLATGHGLAGYKNEEQPVSTIPAAALSVEQAPEAIAQVPAGRTVKIRGAALTAYDVVMVLTEGRGGRWEPVADDAGGALRYLPSGNEPALITMVSRKGIAMTPKPRDIGEDLHSVLGIYQTQLRAWAGSSTPYTRKMWSILLDCAKHIADFSGVPATKESLWDTVCTGRSAQFSEHERPFEQLRYSLEANRGLVSGTHEWVWAVTWSKLYSELVRALSRYNWSHTERGEFNLAASNLERMAFGPPEPTAQKLLALHDAGILRLQQSVASIASTDQGEDQRTGTVEIDSVTAVPGVLTAAAPHGKPANSLIDGLLAAGEIMIRSGERGLLTDTDGTCIDSQGQRNESLSALGRPTEDPTLGHDTLNRTLHTEYREWVKRIATQVTVQSQKVAY